MKAFKYSTPIIIGLGLISVIYIASQWEMEESQVPVVNDKIDLFEARHITVDPNATPGPTYLSYVVKPSFYLEGAALYWQATENGLTYVTKVTVENVVNSNTGTVKGNEYTPGTRWGWGFRVGATYFLPYDGWDLYTDWTRFHVLNHNKQKAGVSIDLVMPVDDFLAATLGTPLPIIKTPGSVKAKWEMDLDWIDLEVGRYSHFGKFLDLRLHAGLRNGWINQRIKQTITSVPIGTRKTPANFNDEFKSNFWGIGPRLGFDTQWNICKEWSVFGDAALSGLIGYFHRSTVEDITAPSDPGTDVLFKLRGNESGASLAVDLSLGLRWERNFRGSKYSYIVEAGYEYHIFTNQAQFMYQFDPNGNLAVQGATLRLSAGF